MSFSTWLAAWNAWQLATPKGTDYQPMKDALGIEQAAVVEQQWKTA